MATTTPAAGLPWLQQWDQAAKAAMVQDGRKTVHYTFPSGDQMVEEYEQKTDLLVSRRWQRRSTLGDKGPWEYEVGEAARTTAGDTLAEASTNPVFMRKDTQDAFQWRIRNLPYPLEVYSLQVDGTVITLRTSNKKYFKKFSITDLERLGLPVTSTIQMAHANNTLIITCPKSKEFLQIEALLREKRKAIKASQDGDADCKTQ